MLDEPSTAWPSVSMATGSLEATAGALSVFMASVLSTDPAASLPEDCRVGMPPALACESALLADVSWPRPSSKMRCRIFRIVLTVSCTPDHVKCCQVFADQLINIQ